MKREDAILLIAALTLAELTLLIVLSWRFYQQVQPEIAGLQSAGSGLSGLLNLITGKTRSTP